MHPKLLHALAAMLRDTRQLFDEQKALPFAAMNCKALEEAAGA